MVLANLREEVVGLMAAQPLATAQSGLDIAAAHEYEQSRGEMLRRLAAGGLTIDCEPRRLSVELINKYTALKRSGAI